MALHNSAAVTSAQRKLEESGAGHAALAAGLLGWRIDAHANDRLAKDRNTEQYYQTEDPVNMVAGTLSVRKALALGARAALTLEESGLALSQGERELSAAIVGVVVDAYDAYRQLELMILRDELARRARDLSLLGLEAVKEQAATGASTQLQLDEAILNHADAVNAVRSSERFLAIAWRRLEQLIGLDLSGVDLARLPVRTLEEFLQMMLEENPVFGPERAFPLAMTLEEMLEVAHTQRAEIAGAQSLVSLAEIAVERARLDDRPRVQLQAKYTGDNDITASLSLDDEWVLTSSATKAAFSHTPPHPISQEGWEVNLGVTFNLWDSGANALVTQRAQSSLAAAQERVGEARDGIELDVLSKHAELMRHFDTLHLARERAQLAHAQRLVEEEKRALGMSTDLLVRQAMIGEWAAVVEAVSARFAYESSVLALARSMGMDAEAMLKLADEMQRW